MITPLIKNTKFTFLTMFAALFSMLPQSLFANDNASSNMILDGIGASFEATLQVVISMLSGVLFYPVFGIPFLVFWLMCGGAFFTLYLGGVNFRLFRHAWRVVAGRYAKPTDIGEVSQFQALTAAVSATVGLGNIAGVAVAITLGGPGAIIWMMVAGFLGMSMKFAEVTMGLKYRQIDKRGRISGGAFYYLTHGLSKHGMPKLGKFLAVFFALCCIGGSLGAGNMFQSNQAVAIIANTFNASPYITWTLSFFMAVTVGIILVGGITRIASITQFMVPIMAILYIVCGLIILGVHADNIPAAFATIWREAFDFSALAGGTIGALVAGYQRAAFSCEAGCGSAPIAHAAARTNIPVRQGCVALIEPFIDTILICTMTGLIIVVSGVYQPGGTKEGVLLVNAAFAGVSTWFPYLLTIVIVLFAYSTLMTWSYYGERAWQYLFGNSTLRVFHVLFCTATFIGGVVQLKLVVDFSDLLFLSMALPNLLGLVILRKELRADVRDYLTKLKSGVFDQPEPAPKKPTATKPTVKKPAAKKTKTKVKNLR